MGFFKSEDFDCIGGGNMVKENAAHVANAKLEREGKVVWSNSPQAIISNHYQPWCNVELATKTHKALLIGIEKIEKCKHPEDKIRVTSDSAPLSGKKGCLPRFIG